MNPIGGPVSASCPTFVAVLVATLADVAVAIDDDATGELDAALEDAGGVVDGAEVVDGCGSEVVGEPEGELGAAVDGHGLVGAGDESPTGTPDAAELCAQSQATARLRTNTSCNGPLNSDTSSAPTGRVAFVSV